jgi:hypothetical protein
MALYELLSDTPKDKLSVLRFRRQMADDARRLGPKEFDQKYKTLDAEDRKAFLPNSRWDMSATYDYFKQQDLAAYDKLINVEEKRVKIRTEENNKLTQQAMSIADMLNPVVESFSTVRNIKGEAQKKYGYNPDEVVDPVEVVNQGMIKEARQRIASGEGISLSQEPKNDMTCIAGVCTLAANQGVDFSAMKGMQGVVKDKQGRYIPQYNPSFEAAKERSGYTELPKGEKPKPGDVVQYFRAEKTGELIPKHMELVTSGAMQIPGKGDQYETFNNYELYSSNLYGNEDGVAEPGREVRGIVKNSDGTFRSDGWDQVRFYRMNPETAEKAVAKTRPDITKKIENKRMFEQSEDFKKLQEAQQSLQSGRGMNVLGDDQGLMMEIIEGVGGNADRGALKKTMMTKAKNPKLVERVIDLMYER